MRFHKYLLFCSIFAIAACNSTKHTIKKRALLFPRGTVLQVSTYTYITNERTNKQTIRPTRFQFTYGLSVPLVLPRRSINLSFCAQVNYNLPATLASLKTKVISARNTGWDLSRETFYKYIVTFLDSVGVNGEECLLRTVCEIAEFPMHIHDEGLLEKIVHFMFT